MVKTAAEILEFLKNATDEERRTYLYAAVCMMDAPSNVIIPGNEALKIVEIEKTAGYQFSPAIKEKTIAILCANTKKRISNCFQRNLGKKVHGMRIRHNADAGRTKGN